MTAAGKTLGGWLPRVLDARRGSVRWQDLRIWLAWCVGCAAAVAIAVPAGRRFARGEVISVAPGGGDIVVGIG